MNEQDKAIKLFEEKKYDKSKEILEKLLEKEPENPLLLRTLGECLVELKEAEFALEYLKKAFELEKSPENEGALGSCYYALKDYDNAQIHLIGSVVDKYNDKYAKILEKALLTKHNDEAMLGLKLLMHETHPKDILVLRDITNFAQKLKKFDIALEHFKILLALCPNDYVAWNNMGLVYEEIGEWTKAYNCYRKALSLNDFFSPNFNLGIMSRKLHRFQDSIKFLKKAALQNPKSPQPKYSLAMSYMMLKDFKNGYPLYANHMTKIMPSFYKNEWDGKSYPDKTICVFATGGLGDMIMFARYLDYLQAHFKKIFILLPKTLHKIFKNNFPYLEIIDSDIIFENFNYATTPMHILKHFDLDFNWIVPKTEGFLEADFNLVKHFGETIFNHNKLKIGINWHGNREGTRTFFNRSTPIENLEPIFEEFKDRAVFYSIQKDETHIDCEKYDNVVNLYSEINDFNDTAAILKNLDFLISIDSSPVHMAGALGVKTFVLLPYANEWRWFTDDDKSIWYDSLELFRQDKEGDWHSAVEKLLNRIKIIY